jgi:GNAT superfamily N-acetyltransferase
MGEVTIRRFRAEDVPWLVAAHRRHYAVTAGFDASFGDLVQRILDEFTADHDPGRERGWIAERGGRRLGSIFCVAAGARTAKLRLFLLIPEARGAGLGRRLLALCMDFARQAGYRDMQLWTHESHRAACALYAATGWRLEQARPAHSFGQDVVEQHWRIDL